MRTLAGFLLVAACVAAQTANPARTLNPKRFSATEIRQDGDVAHLRGSVVVKIGSLIVSAEDADFNVRQWTLKTHGDARLAVQPVLADPEGLFPVADPRRFRADEIHEDGGIMNLHGNVVIGMPGVRITAEDAAFDKTTATITVHGDAGMVVLKANFKLTEDLGPMTVTSEALAGASAPNR
jgi:lipopolysaccharide export system protein LptA